MQAGIWFDRITLGLFSKEAIPDRKKGLLHTEKLMDRVKKEVDIKTNLHTEQLTQPMIDPQEITNNDTTAVIVPQTPLPYLIPNCRTPMFPLNPTL